MGRSFRLLLAVSILHLPILAEVDPRVSEALHRLSREASNFWQDAPGFTARETIEQRILVIHRKRTGVVDAKRKPEFQAQEILSCYAFSSFRSAPEALREFRRIFEIDGKAVEKEQDARTSLAAGLRSRDDDAREDLLKQFEARTLPGAATDFGQVILLFTKSNLDKYRFTAAGQSRVGADTALVIAFEQVGGNQALRIVDGRKKVAHKLQGELLVRQGDYLPLRITLNSVRDQNKSHIRDEATVDYAVSEGALLPASLTYRRFVDDGLSVESTYRYSAWERLQ